MTLFEREGKHSPQLWMRIEFDGAPDGLQRIDTDPANYSLLKLPHHAPLDG